MMKAIELNVPDLSTYPSKVAQAYMANKGYHSIIPVHHMSVESQPIWYYYYDLDEGLLELEVDTTDKNNPHTRVVAFRQAEHADILS